MFEVSIELRGIIHRWRYKSIGKAVGHYNKLRHQGHDARYTTTNQTTGATHVKR